MAILIEPAYVLATSPDENNPHIGYQNWVRGRDADDLFATSEVATGPKDAILRPDTAEYWQGDTLPAIIRVDFGQARSVDYVGIAGHTIGSSGASVLIEHSPDNSVWTQFGSTAAPAGDAPLLFLDESISRRFWRVTFNGSADVPKMAVLYIGEILVVQRSIYGGHSPAILSRDTKLNQNMSDGGQFLGQYIRRRGINGKISLNNLTAGWYREHFDPFVQAAREFPFFVAWRPVDYPQEVAYGWTDKNITPTNIGKKDFMQVSFDFKGVGYAD